MKLSTSLNLSSVSNAVGDVGDLFPINFSVFWWTISFHLSSSNSLLLTTKS